jgi:hypothetical protein
MKTFIKILEIIIVFPFSVIFGVVVGLFLMPLYIIDSIWQE